MPLGTVFANPVTNSIFEMHNEAKFFTLKIYGYTVNITQALGYVCIMPKGMHKQV